VQFTLQWVQKQTHLGATFSNLSHVSADSQLDRLKFKIYITA